MDFLGIIDASVRVIFGYAIMFFIITLLSLPFIYAVLIYDRLKERRRDDAKLVDPFNKFNLNRGIFGNRNKRDTYVMVRREISEQRRKIDELIKSNRQLSDIVLRMREYMRDY